MITHSDSIKTISKALLTFQGAVDGVEKNKTNPGFKSRYANLEAVRDTAVPELQKVGLVYAQSPGKIVDGVMSMTTMIIHAESGEWMKFEGDITLGKRDPQGTGSAMTYMQRYSLMAALGLPPVDDDGEAATDRSRPQQTQPQKPAPTPFPAAPEHDEAALYARLSKANDNCKTKADFNRTWSAPNIIAAQSQLSIENHARLETEKANKFAELEVKEPSTYVPPSFPETTE